MSETVVDETVAEEPVVEKTGGTDEYVPTGYVPQYSLENYPFNTHAAGFRKRVVQKAESTKVKVKLKDGRIIRASLSDIPSRRVRGALYSVLGEGLRIYQFAPNQRSIDWTIAELAEILITMRVITTEWLKDGRQMSRTGLIEPDELAEHLKTLRGLLFSVERELSDKKRQNQEAAIAQRAAAVKAAMAR